MIQSSDPQGECNLQRWGGIRTHRRPKKGWGEMGRPDKRSEAVPFPIPEPHYRKTLGPVWTLFIIGNKLFLAVTLPLLWLSFYNPFFLLSERSAKPVTMSKRLQISIYRMLHISQAWWMGCPGQRSPKQSLFHRALCSMWWVRVMISPRESRIVKVKTNTIFFLLF